MNVPDSSCPACIQPSDHDGVGRIKGADEASPKHKLMPDDLSKRDRSHDTLESCDPDGADPDGADSEEQEEQEEAKSCWETVKVAGSMIAVG